MSSHFTYHLDGIHYIFLTSFLEEKKTQTSPSKINPKKKKQFAPFLLSLWYDLDLNPGQGKCSTTTPAVADPGFDLTGGVTGVPPPTWIR